MLPGETIASGATDVCEKCGRRLEIKVLMSRAGYYIGTSCCVGPVSRETGYYTTREKAEADLETGNFQFR